MALFFLMTIQLKKTLQKHLLNDQFHIGIYHYLIQLNIFFDKYLNVSNISCLSITLNPLHRHN